MKKIASYWNSFSGRILLTVVIGLAFMAVGVSFFVLVMSQNVFMDTYGKSQEKLIRQIENDFNHLHEQLLDVADTIDSSWAFRLYLTSDSDLDNIQEYQNMYQMEKDLSKTSIDRIESPNILVIGANGKHYLSRTETISVQYDQIWNSDAVKKALQNKEKMHYTFSEGAYSMTTKSQDVIVVSKALYYQESKEVYGVVLVTLTQDNLKSYYDYFITENSDFFVVNANEEIVCSNKTERIHTKIQDSYFHTDRTDALIRENGKYLSVFRRKMPYQNMMLLGVIDNQLAIDQLYNMPLLIGVCIFLSSGIFLFCMIYTNKTVRPLSRMVHHMRHIRDEEFKEHVEVEGTTELRELAVTYNQMLDDTRKYIKELVKIQRKQRKAEIKALQMQINPHYIYNTLASIKMLVYQNDVEKTTLVIDAFINLLKNTISNKNEFITVEQEQKNLMNYTLIIYTRYGERVGVEYYISKNCEELLIPKLILQPFIENAFFHAFPSERRGTIQIFIKTKKDVLSICIRDNGVGMDPEKASQLAEKEEKKEYYSGIGIHNVHERLQLLFGEEYGVQIESRKEEGTKINIALPVMREENEKTND